MNCPNCQHTDTAINEIDDSVCCTNCGNVIETHQLVAGSFGIPQQQTNVPIDIVSIKYINKKLSWF